MLILRNIIITLLLITLAMISVVGLMVEAPAVLNYTPDRLNALGRSVLTVMRPGSLLFFAWLIILLGTLLVFFMTIARPRKRMKIEVQMGGGRVVIMDAAIKKYIRNALSEIGEVTVKKIDLREQRNLVTTDIYADVRTRENLPTLERRIISRVRSALAEDLGITNLGDVHVFIKNFEVTGRPINTRRDEPEPEPVSPKKTPASDAEPLTESESSIEPGTAAVAGTAAGAGAASHLSEPEIKPEEAEPIVIDESTTNESKWDSDTFARPAEDKPAVTETSDTDNVILAEKPLSGSSEGADAGQHEDIDEPLPWGAARPDDSDKDEEDRGPLPL